MRPGRGHSCLAAHPEGPGEARASAPCTWARPRLHTGPEAQAAKVVLSSGAGPQGPQTQEPISASPALGLRVQGEGEGPG